MKIPSLTTTLFTFAIVGALAAPIASGALITVGGATRYASVDSAVIGGTQEPGGPNSSADINAALFGSSVPSPTPVWLNNGGITSANGSGVGSNGSLLQINLDSASVGFGNVGTNFGTWSITSPTYWSDYGSAVLSFHIGNGGGSPDGFVFLLKPGLLTGTFSVTGTNGWSNIHLWTSTNYDTPNDTPGVPDGGTTLAALGLSLLGLGSMRRFLIKNA